MNRWTLTLKRQPDQVIDASELVPQLLAGKSVSEIEATPWARQTIGDWFDVAATMDAATLATSDDHTDVACGGIAGHATLVIKGDASRLSHIGSTMVSGEIIVEDEAGDFLGAAACGKRVGMSGGRIVVTGNAGTHVGHRMRRGEIWVAGRTGRFTAANMVAGTIVVAGEMSGDCAIGMRRGTLIAERVPELAKGRFSLPVRTDFLIAEMINAPLFPAFDSFWSRWKQRTLVTRRGDRAVGGQAEIVTPE